MTGSGPAAEPHVPVLLDAVCAALAPLDGRHVIDGTFGAGGYTRRFLSEGATVTALDRDPTALAAARDWEDAEPRLTLIAARFGDLATVVAGHEVAPDAVVLDIGVSSMQLDQAERGFSFLRDGPLDMRMSDTGPTAADIVNETDEATLADLLYLYGEERASRRIASAIVRARGERPLTRTSELADIVAATLSRARPGQAHPATRSFQALRIAVNDELGELVRALCAAEAVLPEGGHLAVVTFHSLEDRIVKRFFQTASATSTPGTRHGPAGLPLSPRWDRPARPVAPTETEISSNPRARSARLRSARRTGAPSQPVDAHTLGLPELPPATRNGKRRRAR